MTTMYDTLMSKSIIPKIIAAGLVLCLLTQTTIAAAFTNEEDVRSALQTQGVNLMHVNFVDIDSLCYDFRQNKDEDGYLNCEYNKGLTVSLYLNDKQQCSTRAKAAGLPQHGTETVTENDANGKRHVYQRSISSIDAQDLRRMQEAAFVECMQGLDWINANDWKPGQRKNYCIK
jgi:hypothetical protein